MLTSQLMMIRPALFYANTQTSNSNEFQQSTTKQDIAEITKIVQKEFDDFVDLLRLNGITVNVFSDTLEPETPDAIFPNNWVSFHTTGQIFLYPMMAPNRQLERRTDILDQLKQDYLVKAQVDLSHFEKAGKYLEGTGSMVLDRANKIAYACLSPRTDNEVLQAFAKEAEYEIVNFNATGSTGKPIYHTNVMMCIGNDFVVVCLRAIPTPEERDRVTQALTKSGKVIIEITPEQMNNFAGNMLQLTNEAGETILVLSKRAYLSLDDKQLGLLQRHNSKLLTPDLTTIETLGGGSARCMMAEIFLPINKKRYIEED